MKEDLKQLLLQDLSARLPYGVKVRIKATFVYENGTIRRVTEDKTLHLEDISDILDMYTSRELDELKPYLRPMSSMTEKEKKQFKNFICIDYDAFFEKENGYINQAKIMSDGIDWLLKNHFDFRNLIGLKLAIEVTEDNNPYKE